MVFRPEFESHLGRLGDDTISVAGSNAKPGSRISSQDVTVSGHKLQPFSAVNASNPAGDQSIKLDPKDFPQQTLEATGNVPLEDDYANDDWLTRARDAFQISDSNFQSEIKPKLEDNIRAFNNKHKNGSYLNKSPAGWTSKIYIPKTRAVLNKQEAVACIAFFSNEDIISMEAENPYDPQEVVAVEVRKALLQFRLKRSVKWYQTLMGAFQDSMVQGIVIGQVKWDGATDKPEVKVHPLDKVRFDPDADWTDPVNSSPYWITLSDMTIGDFRSMVGKGQFYDINDGVLSRAIGATDNSVTQERNQSKGAGLNISTISDYNRITIQEHIHRQDGKDFIFYTLGTICRISDVLPIEQVYFHGKRPYVLGCSDIESHVVFSAGFPEVMSGVQEEINEMSNQRLNNIKLALNKKYAVKNDSPVDLDALLRNQPGSAVYVEDTLNDIREIETKDVTGTSYMEIEKMNQYIDELTGNINPPNDLPNRIDEGKSMQIAQAQVNVQLEYRLRTFCETWVSPILGLVDLTESFYETDPKVLELIARRVGIVRVVEQAPVQAPLDPVLQQQPQKPVMPEIVPFTPDHLRYMLMLLKKTLNINANVGMNATDPFMKGQKLIMAIQACKNLVPGLQPDKEEVPKEIMATFGYTDGMRFFQTSIDPKDIQIRQLQMAIKLGLQKEQVKGENAAKVAIIKEHGANLRKAADIEQQTQELQAENAQFVVDHGLAVEQHAHNVMQSNNQPPQQVPAPAQE